jgi:predicted acylesterase/phospholipase RssA
MRTVEEVLYIVPAEIEAQVRAEMEGAGARPQRGPLGKDWLAVPAEGRTFRFRIVNEVPQALALLVDHYFNYLVVDNRGPKKPADCFSDTLAHTFMEKIHYSGDPERMYPLHRVYVVLDEDACLPVQAFELGKLRIGGFLVKPFEGALFAALASRRQAELTGPTKTALCLSGGGVEGFLYEVGVLKALNAHLQSKSVTDFDIYCGISAGSMLAAFLANATEPEEISDVLVGLRKEGNVEPFTPSIIYDLDVKEFGARLWQLWTKMQVTSWHEMISGLIKSVPVGFFRGDSLRRFVERQLSVDGRTNDFRQLKRELYIGATEQDTSTHTVFGWGQWRDIPISTAVRASCALTPFYEPEKIRGRYYVDGQYTRTSNFHFALERGAKLIVVINPLVPLRVDQPGYVRAKGGVFSALQALKAVIHTRFMHSIRHAATNYPELDFVLFSPEHDDMRLLSGSPMKYNIRTEVLNTAYRSTVRKIQRDFEILGGTFAKHGFVLQRFPRLRSVPKTIS